MTTAAPSRFGDAPRRPGRPLRDIPLMILIAAIALCVNAVPGRFVSSQSSVGAGINRHYNHNNYHPYLYDRTTPQFTPDGRLLQVEYAGLAPSQSLPLVVVRVANAATPSSSTSSSSSSYCLVVAARRRSTTTRTTRRTGGGGEATDAPDHQEFTRSEASAFERILLVPVHSPYGGGGENTAVICMSGVLSDCLLLVRTAQELARSHFQTFGRLFTVRQLAAALANQCQERAFGGGIRPYGSTVVVCGYDEAEAAAATGEAIPLQMGPESGLVEAPSSGASAGVGVRVWQTDPSGALRQLLSTSRCSVEVVGGSDAVRSTIRRKIQDRLVALSNVEMEVGAALRIVMNVLHNELDSAASDADNNQDSNSRKSAAMDSSSSSLDLEAAILSPGHGDPYKLTPAQIDQILIASRAGASLAGT